MNDQLPEDAFARLLAFRDELRRFLRWSEQQARAAGLTPMQHQLLLAVEGHAAGSAPTISEIAEHLLLRHHSVVELIDRAEKAGLVSRAPDPVDGRAVRISLTPEGERRIVALSELHLAELERLAGMFAHLAP